MSKLKITAKICSLAYVTWWIIWLIYSKIAELRFVPTEDIDFNVHIAFVYLSLVGLVCSIMLALGVFAFCANKKHRIFRAATLLVCAAANVLYQVVLFSLLGVKSEVVTDEKILLIALPWAICAFVALILTIVQFVIFSLRKIRKA